MPTIILYNHFHRKRNPELQPQEYAMTPRDNLLSLLHRKGYAEVPVFFEMCPHLHEVFQARAKAAGKAGISVQEFFGDDLFPYAPVPTPHFADRPGLDWRAFYPDSIKPETTFDDDYGIGHEPGSEFAMHMTRMLHPMETFDSLEQMQAYPWPDWSEADPVEVAARVMEIRNAGKASYGFMQMTIWEIAWYLRNMEELMADMMDDDEKAVYIFDMVTERAIQRARFYAKAGVDILFFGDDVGMQATIMMSPDLYRAWIKPNLRKVVDAAKAINPGIIIDYHTCGFVTPLIADLAEGGIDVLNPVQPECMDFADVHRDFGDLLSFRGVIGTQTTMPFGTPEEVKRTVWRALDIAGAKGGLVACPTHLLEPEVPWENIEAYVAACREYPGAGR